MHQVDDDAIRLRIADGLLHQRGEFRRGHIINAVHIPEAQIEAELPRLEKHRDQPLILVCQSGQSASRPAAKLKKAGFEKVHILAGGILGWEGASLPLTKK